VDKDECSHPAPFRRFDPDRDRHLFVLLGRMSRGRGSGLKVMLGNGADILGGVAGLAGGCGAWPQLAGVAPSGRLATSISAALLIKAEEAADEELGAVAL
jgi:hypothetical protein